ncbi:prolyl oligopeptidase family serine peptidase [Paenibacillus doosanensis]|uniref:alpha/beta hydrolase family protein n=1 Tax=Paenibacillus doosanensis TaxID=1229154 RepID=UPI0021803EF3|nr:prolyl oligopeptidase family serine peptidase [Paenibacillus doosanensis]MCS7462769.1 prolyl oligopeptidase family serine peptidase [Paenibacillus doosanensis]
MQYGRPDIAQEQRAFIILEGIVVLPPGFKIQVKKSPTLVFLHGGPANGTVTASLTELISARGESAAFYLALHGYAVFLPNFRGSSGYGDTFMEEAKGASLMSAPYEDVIAGVKHLIDLGITDPDRLGIYGSSFGAMLVTWTVAKTSIFKGAAAAVGIYDLLYDDRYGNKGSYEEKWVDKQIYKMNSPIEQVNDIEAPVLFFETSAERSLYGSVATPFINGLRSKNTEAYLICYPKAFHNGGWNDIYKKDYMKRLRLWFDHCIHGKDLPGSFYEA